MVEKETNKEQGFDFLSDVEAVLSYISQDKCIDELLDAIFPQRGSIETAFVDFLSGYSFPTEIQNAGEVISSLSGDKDNLYYFFARLSSVLAGTIDQDPGKKKDLLILLDRALFWQMYGIAIKKCLGEGLAKKQVNDLDFFGVLPDDINTYQKDAHRETLLSFNTDARKYSFKRTPDLKYYLHPIHSRNKSLKTKKKNIRRVEKRAKRIMQIYGLKRQGNMFSNGRHLVPKQFAEGIIKLCINMK